MNTKSKIHHESSISGDLARTSYKWSLENWSLLCDLYKRGVTTPQFEVMHGYDCKGTLMFLYTESAIMVQFEGKLQYYTLKADVSIVDKNMKKLLTAKPVRTRTMANEVCLDFPKNFTKELISQYLENDTLTMFAEIVIVCKVRESELSTNTWNWSFNSVARDKLKDMFEARELCDVTFNVENQLIPGHKLILAAHSDVFRAMFMTEMTEQRDAMKIEDVDVEVFKLFLSYMYTGKVEGIDEVVTDLILVADKYQVIDLIKACENYMIAHEDLENATQYLLIAHRLHLSRLEEESVQFIQNNMETLRNPINYKMLSDYPSLIIKIFASNYDEEDSDM